MVQDPVCKMILEKEEATKSFEFNGITYYFCSNECFEKFLKNPEKFISKQKKPENSGC